MRIKELLCSAPVLYTPSRQDNLVLETDASDVGVGGCLKAFDNYSNRFLGVVGYCSKKFNETEKNWHTVVQEGFAVIFAVRHFRHYLIFDWL